jgi:hypothetical protein
MFGPDFSGISPADETHMVGDAMTNVGGSYTLMAFGDGIYLAGAGDGTAVHVSADSAIGLYCSPAEIAMTSSAEGTVGSIGLAAGELGSINMTVGTPEVGTSVTAEPESLTLSVGVVDVGARIKLTPESITLSVGAPGAGASLSMTPESITLKVGEVTLTLSLEGIVEDVAECSRELTPEGHNFTAAETEFNVGVQGQTSEGPTEEAEVEAGTVENETLGSDTTDAAKNTDAGIMITE